MKGISQKDLSDAGFNCNVHENISRINGGLVITYDISYFGTSDKTNALSDVPRKPIKKLISYIELLGYNCDIKERYSLFWDKNFKYLRCY